MRIRVLVADQGGARLFDVDAAQRRLALAGERRNPGAHLLEQELVSDKPGRVFDHAPGAGRRGAVARHGTAGEHTAHRQQGERFAREVAQWMDQEHGQRGFDQLVLVAGPVFLGMLRGSLGEAVASRIAVEVHKDLTHQSAATVADALPATVWQAAARHGGAG